MMTDSTISEKKSNSSYEDYINHLRRRANISNGEFSYIHPVTLKVVKQTFNIDKPLMYVVDAISSEIVLTNNINTNFGHKFDNINAAKIYQLTKLTAQKFGEVHLYLDELLDELETLTNKYPEYAL